MYQSVVAGALLFACVQAGPTAPAPLSHYRGVVLGHSLEQVVQALHLEPAAVQVLHESPSLVQQVTWRPHRFVSGSTMTTDSLAEMVLTFHGGRLARVVAFYDPRGTEGMIDADFQELMTAAYGVSMLDATPTQLPMQPVGRRRTLGRWADAETMLLLWREDYPRRLGLTITSLDAEPLLQHAIVQGELLATAQAPKREEAARLAGAAAIKERDEQIRLQNKAKFKP